MKQKATIADMIQKLGGREAVAAAVGVSASRISQVKGDGRFPAEWFVLLENHAKACGVPIARELFSWKERPSAQGDGAEAAA